MNRSQDQRFLSQFSANKITKFTSFSKYPLCYKDVSFWLPEMPNDNYKNENPLPTDKNIDEVLKFHPNEVYEVIYSFINYDVDTNLHQLFTL